MDTIINSIKTAITEFGPSILAALVLLIVGLFAIGFIVRMAKKLMANRGLDTTLQKFLGSLLSWTLKILLFVMVAAKLGIETTSFAAILGAAGLAIGLALQGSLANFAGGALIMVFKPFKIGDLIEAQGVTGVVKEIQIFTTSMTTPDNKLVIVPNGALSNGNIVNYTAEGKLRVDLTIGIGYGSDIKKAKDVLMKAMADDPKVLTEPAPSIHVSELADSSVNLAVRPWASVADYWDVYFHTLENAKYVLDEAGIEIPFPQRDINLKKEN